MKMVLQRKTSIRKGQMSFFGFRFWNFELVPINSALNSALGSLTRSKDNIDKCNIENRNICDGLSCITSLVNLLYNLDLIWGRNP